MENFEYKKLAYDHRRRKRHQPDDNDRAPIKYFIAICASIAAFIFLVLLIGYGYRANYYLLNDMDPVSVYDASSEYKNENKY